MTPRPFDLVIFDCDGVLVDSEPIANRVLCEQLEAAGLLPQFEGRIFCAADVVRPKPAPDLFLHAANSMGVSASKCAVIEDTPTGARAGIAAGMTVFGYAAGTSSTREALEAEGAKVFEDMTTLATLIGGRQ